jgi:hypothetical protein
MRRFGTAVAILCVTCAIASTARAEKTPAELRLGKRIDIDFVETPALRAIEQIAKLANVAAVFDHGELKKDVLKSPISLQLQGIPAREALDLVVKSADIGYLLEGHVVFVSSLQRTMARSVVLKTYDIRDLAYEVAQFAGPDFTGITTWSASKHAGAAPIALEDSASESVMQSGSMADLIMNRIMPGHWSTRYGTSIEERNGRLIVVQTEAVHDQIAAFIKRMRASEMLYFRSDAIVYKGLRSQLEQAVSVWRTPGFLTPIERTQVEERLAASGLRPHGSARTMCLNNQRNHLVVGSLQRYVSDVDASGSVLDPVIGCTFEGLVVDFVPLASHDRRFVTLYLSVGLASLEGMKTKEVMVGNIQGSRKLRPPAEHEHGDEGKDPAVAEMSLVVEPSPGPARIQLPDRDVREVRTNVQVPMGTTACFITGARSGARGRAMLLLFRSRPCEPVLAAQ